MSFAIARDFYLEREVIHIKRKLAVFANGWGIDYVQNFLSGVSEITSQNDTDIFIFMDFSAKDDYTKANIGESNIFRLPDLKDFDFAIFMTNSFNLQEEIDYIYRSIMEARIPAISLEYSLNGIPCIQTDNYSGMRELTTHLIQEHGARHIVFVSGPKDHYENSVRLRAVQDVMRENGLTLSDKDILYGRWSREPSMELAAQWTEEHGHPPDAFICANDMMALGVCAGMKSIGYRVPEDVLVTGFDRVKLGQEAQPPLATIGRDWHTMGTTAMQLLLDKYNGGEIPENTIIPARFIRRESCGCAVAEYSLPHQTSDALSYDSHFRRIHWAVKETNSSQQLYNSLKRIFQQDNWIEGKNFMLCLENEFFRIQENDENLKTTGYSDDLDVICALNNGIARPHQIMSYRDAMFRAANTNPEPATYIFVPLHNDERAYGFAMLSRNVDVMTDHYLYIWTRQLNLCLEQVRRNITIAMLTQKLTDLSVTDVLTGAYNRAGCEQIAYPMLEELHRLGKEGIIMLADIDRMKLINDQYGHASGDLALRTIVSVLRSQLPSDWVICRIGGDEFFIGGSLTDSDEPEQLIENVSEKLKQEIRRLQIPFPLGISIGYIRIAPDENLDIESKMREADQQMYLIKNKHHEA